MNSADIPGVSVHVFLPQGAADGIRIAQIPGWTGRVAYAPAHVRDQLAERPECDRAGLHIFMGDDGQGGEMVRMRVSSRLETSLSEHYWAPHITQVHHVIVITDRDDMLTAPELHWIGYQLIADLHAGGWNIRDEDIASGIPIGEAARAQIERFMEQVRIVLPVMGVL